MEKWKLVTKASTWEITFKIVIHENLSVERYMGTVKGMKYLRSYLDSTLVFQVHNMEQKHPTNVR